MFAMLHNYNVQPCSLESVRLSCCNLNLLVKKQTNEIQSLAPFVFYKSALSCAIEVNVLFNMIIFRH